MDVGGNAYPGRSLILKRGRRYDRGAPNTYSHRRYAAWPGTVRASLQAAGLVVRDLAPVPGSSLRVPRRREDPSSLHAVPSTRAAITPRPGTSRRGLSGPPRRDSRRRLRGRNPRSRLEWTRTPGAGRRGAALIVTGGTLAVRGVVDLGENLTVVPRPPDRARLVDHGACRLVRHPICGALVLAAIGWGFATASPSAIGGGFVLSGFFDLKSRRKEGWLGEWFAGYAAYRTRTRKLIPWVY